MKLSINFLRRYMEINWGIDELVDKLRMSGTGVEEILKPWEGMENLVCSEIVKIEKHPNAENLVICHTNVGDSIKKLITSDKSLKIGDKVIYAPEGTKLKNGVVEKVKIRGVESEGMLCSLEEIGLEEKSEFVFRFPKDFEIKVGQNLYESLGLDDYVLDLEITPNRPDCLSHLGMAREIHALGGGEVRIPDSSIPEGSILDVDVGKFIKIGIENPDDCLRYVAAYIQGVEVMDSPLWLKRDLSAVGIRPINNIVDITNFVMMEMGHPIHAFDYDKLKRKNIYVRRAKRGEKLQLLDGNIYEFEGFELLITDGVEPLAMAGVMGGEKSGIDENTKNVLIEVAYFSPPIIRKGAKSHGIMTDSSYRFERGVDPNDCVDVIRRVVSLILRLAGGKSARNFYDLYPKKIQKKKVELRKEKLTDLLGMDVMDERIEEILEKLGMKVERGKGEKKYWIVEIPTFRPDVEREVDLIEEVGRIVGYEELEGVLPETVVFSAGRTKYQKFRKKAIEVMNSLGYNETVNFSMVDPKHLERIKIHEFYSMEPVFLENPIASDMSLMRPSLIYNIIETISYNYARQIRNIKLFEVGRTFRVNRKFDTGIQEREMVSFAALGRNEELNYFYKGNVNFYIFKGDVEEFLDKMKVREYDFEEVRIDGFHPTRTAKVVLNGRILGVFGQISRKICEIFDVKSELYVAEFDLKNMFELSTEIPEYSPIPVYPNVRRDLSLIVPKKVKFKDIVEIIKKTGGNLVEDTRVIDYYVGKGIPEGFTGITISIYLRSMERTLTESQVSDTVERIIAMLKNRLSVGIRGE